ncbi:hypothetical protein Tco_0601181 [Tanacetum coccineum]
MMVSIPMTFPLANSTEYLVSTVDGTMSLKGLILAEVRLLSTRFHVLAIISSFDSTSGPSKVLSIRESHNLCDSNSTRERDSVSWLRVWCLYVIGLLSFGAYEYEYEYT